MRKAPGLLLALALLLGVSPARAQTVQHAILLPDFGTPSLGRVLASEAGLNGVIGYLIAIQGTKTKFTLATVSAPTGVESFDIFFYDDSNGKPGTVIAAYNLCPGGELRCDKSGSIPSRARWAVVTLVLGVNGTFRYVAS
ncbi:MAG TPA: hypothetical protein VM841_12160 [Actinomycetota bacterium]|nr:hypothetical protein [Actinomycetota bacterium]